MLRPRLCVALVCVTVISACSRKVKNKTRGEYVAQVLSQDAIPVVKPKPTRPEGGVVEGKGPALNPEEAEQRRNRNIVQPILFGSSVGGVMMNSPYSRIMNTLVYYGSQDGVDFFQEHLLVAWSSGADPVPFQIGIEEGYAGRLKLPEPYGEVSLGQQMAGKIANVDELRQFMLIAGAAFENKSPSSYDCENSLSCQFDETDLYYILHYRRGGLYFTKGAGLPLSFIYFTQPQTFYAPLVNPILHNLSIGGLTFQTSRAAAEVRLGPPMDLRSESGIDFHYYDKGNFAVAWSGDNTPSAFKAVGTYQGSQNFGGTIGTRKIGDSFAAHASTDDNGTGLLLALDRSLNNRAADHDCTATIPASCELVVVTTVTPARILLVIDRSVYSFTHDANRNWLSVGMREP